MAWSGAWGVTFGVRHAVDHRFGDFPYAYALFFGHSTLPGFVSTANTIRAYKVSLTIVLQSIAQLSARYGVAVADAIQGGFNTAMTYPGSDPETCLFFERLAGKVRERQRKFQTATTDTSRIQSHECVRHPHAPTRRDPCRPTNRNPVLIAAKGYFEERRFKKLAALGPVTMPLRKVVPSEMPMLRL